MNWTSILSGTSWPHAAGFGIAAIALVSLASVMASRPLRNHPALRHGILLSALIACLTVPVIGLATGSIDSPLLGVPVRSEILVVSTSAWPSTAPSAGVAAITSWEPVESGQQSSSQSITAADAIEPVWHDQSHESGAAWADPPTVWSVVAILWSFGTSLLLLAALRSHRRGWSIRQRAELANSHRTSRCCRIAHRHVDLTWLPEIMRSDEVFAPVVHGVLDPVVILPTKLTESLSDSELTDVLVHELAHVRRRDTPVVIAETLARALFWPIATVHLLIRDLGRAREEVCDNFVLAHRSSIQYAETLLKLAQFASGRAVAMQAVGILPWKGELEKRIAGLLDGKRSRSRTLSPSIAIPLGLLFVGSTIAFTGSRLVATEVATGEALESNERPAAEQKNLARHTVRVVDWQGDPVAGARVELRLLGFSAAGAGGGNRPPGKDAFAGMTDADGRIVVPYPTVSGLEGMPTTSLYLAVEHPQHPRWLQSRKLTSTDQIKLSRPVVLSINASLRPDGSAVESDLYAVVQERETRWSMNGGTLISGPVDVTANRLLVVHAPKDSPASFSDVIDLSTRTIAGNRIEIETVLERSVEMRGRLSDDIARPIRGGRVIAMSSPSAGDSWASWWSTTTTISEDGIFVLQNLPPRRHVQLIATCDGGVSRSPRPSEVRKYCREHGCRIQGYSGVIAGKTAPQLYFTGQDSSDVVIPMDLTGDVEVSVKDRESRPIANVEIQFSPNQQWHAGGNQLLGAGYDSLEFLRRRSAGESMPAYRELASQTTNQYTAVTDENGRTLVRNLPAGIGWYEFEGREHPSRPYHWFTAKHDDYRLIPNEPRLIKLTGLDVETVDIISGEVAEIVVQMERKTDMDR